MPTMVYGMDDAVKQWVAMQLGQNGFAGGSLHAFGIAENGALIGGTVLHNHYPREGVVEMTCASTNPKWLSRAMIRSVFNYAFCVLACQMVILRVSEINAVMMNIAKRLGFSGYLIPRLRSKTEGEWIFTLTDDQWRASPFNRSKV